MRNTGIGRIQINGFHSLVKALAIFGFVDSIGIGANHLDTKLIQHTVLGQIQGTVQCGLTTHGGQQRIRTLVFNNFGNCAPFNRFDIGGVGHGRVGHNGGWIGVNQNNSEALFPKRFTGLGT